MSEGTENQAGEVAVVQPEPEWPDHFPEGCPGSCSETTPVDGIVFRLTRGNDKDWKSWKEIPRESGHGECHDAGLSVFRDLEEIRAHRQSRGYLRDRPITCAHLSKEHGHIAPIPGGGTHSSLWLRRATLRQYRSLFKVIE